MVSPTEKTLFAGSRSSMTPVVSERIARQSSTTCVCCPIAGKLAASARYTAVTTTTMPMSIDRPVISARPPWSLA